MGHWEATGITDEWYTPPVVFDHLQVMFDLDVSPARQGNGHVPTVAKLDGCGLIQPWHGFVWMNPPFGGRNALVPWLDKFFEHGNGIALTPDRTSAPWFWDAWVKTDAVLFTRKIRFLRPDGSEGTSPSTGSALWAAGQIAVSALNSASRKGFGILANPVKDTRHDQDTA